MQERNNSTAGISVRLWFTRFWNTRLSCTQHEFFAYIHWFSNLYHAFGRSMIKMLCLERRFISPSFCKCDRGLSQESIRKARYFECLVFLFVTDHGHKFWSPRICQHEDTWPIRTRYQNLVSWNGGIQTYDWIVSHDAPRFMFYGITAYVTYHDQYSSACAKWTSQCSMRMVSKQVSVQQLLFLRMSK